MALLAAMSISQEYNVPSQDAVEFHYDFLHLFLGGKNKDISGRAVAYCQFHREIKPY
jgi:hypothetical protein